MTKRCVSVDQKRRRQAAYSRDSKLRKQGLLQKIGPFVDPKISLAGWQIVSVTFATDRDGAVRFEETAVARRIIQPIEGDAPTDEIQRKFQRALTELFKNTWVAGLRNLSGSDW